MSEESKGTATLEETPQDANPVNAPFDDVQPDTDPFHDTLSGAYADKQKKAKDIAKRMLKTNELGREVELEVLAEDDKILADFVKQELEALLNTPHSGPVSLITKVEDIEKLPPGPREAMQHFVEQLGGKIPTGGLFQVKLDSVEGVVKAIDTIITNGAFNLGTLVISKLAAVKASKLAMAIEFLAEHSLKIQKAKSQLKGKAAKEADELLRRIDATILNTFGGDHNYDACLELHEALQPKPKSTICKTK